MVFDLVLKHCEYIFLLTSSAQDLNSVSLLTSMVKEKEAFSKTKIKRVGKKYTIHWSNLRFSSVLNSAMKNRNNKNHGEFLIHSQFFESNESKSLKQTQWAT